MNFSRRLRDGRSERQGGTNLIHPNFGEFLLNFSVGQRIISAFIAAALIAAMMIGAIGLQRVQVLEAQSEFYQDLFRPVILYKMQETSSS